MLNDRKLLSSQVLLSSCCSGLIGKTLCDNPQGECEEYKNQNVVFLKKKKNYVPASKMKWLIEESYDVNSYYSFLL